jgi:hypothetical protein
VPRASNAQIIRACFAAKATAAMLVPDRALSASTQTLLRTHCGDVVEIVNELATQLQLAPNEWHPIRNIASLMQSADVDIIVPIMLDILTRTEVELSSIGAAIRDKEFEKALWLKERYRFDVTHLYERLDQALTQMSELRSHM